MYAVCVGNKCGPRHTHTHRRRMMRGGMVVAMLALVYWSVRSLYLDASSPCIRPLTQKNYWLKIAAICDFGWDNSYRPINITLSDNDREYSSIIPKSQSKCVTERVKLTSVWWLPFPVRCFKWWQDFYLLNGTRFVCLQLWRMSNPIHVWLVEDCNLLSRLLFFMGTKQDGLFAQAPCTATTFLKLSESIVKESAVDNNQILYKSQQHFRLNVKKGTSV